MSFIEPQSTMSKQNVKNAELWRYVEEKRQPIEKSLREFLPLAPPQIETRFNEAVEYALFSGGKRLRPVLTLLGAELFGGDAEMVLPAACAAEYIHTSSLIFDDFPVRGDGAFGCVRVINKNQSVRHIQKTDADQNRQTFAELFMQ